MRLARGWSSGPGMSYDAIRWAMAQQVGKSSTKFLLVAMADCVNSDGARFVCWPSCRHLAEVTGQDVKTVEAGLRRLREMGAIEDTGERKGVTGQVIVYRLKTPENGVVTTQANATEIPANPPEIGVVNEDGNTPVFPGNTPVFPMKDPQIPHERPPKTGDGTSKEPIKEPVMKEKTATCVAQISGVASELFADFMTVRKAKKAGALTATAVAGLEREAKKSGLTNSEAVTYCIEANWQSFNANFYANREGQSSQRNTAKPRATQHSGFKNLDYTAGVNADGTFA